MQKNEFVFFESIRPQTIDLSFHGDIEAHAVRRLKDGLILYKIRFSPHETEQIILPVTLCTLKCTKETAEKFIENAKKFGWQQAKRIADSIDADNKEDI